ncbi:MAG: hypothetical protein ACE5D7_04870, partial [Fidelibacterota bacterium]
NPEVVSGTEMADMIAFNLDGTPYTNFPINLNFGFGGSPTIEDTDGDGDLEIFLGSSGDLVNIDIKSNGDISGYWNTFRGNFHRTGYYDPSTGSDCSSCTLGDVNCDGTIDVLDVVRAVYIIINSPDDIGDCEYFLGDINGDTVLDVLDLVTIVNIIMDPN